MLLRRLRRTVENAGSRRRASGGAAGGTRFPCSPGMVVRLRCGSFACGGARSGSTTRSVSFACPRDGALGSLFADGGVSCGIAIERRFGSYRFSS